MTHINLIQYKRLQYLVDRYIKFIAQCHNINSLINQILITSMSVKVRLCANCNNYHCDNFVPVGESTVLEATPKHFPFRRQNSIYTTAFKESITTTDFQTLKKPEDINSMLNQFNHATPPKLNLPERPYTTLGFNNYQFGTSTVTKGNTTLPTLNNLPRLTFEANTPFKETPTQRINNLLAQSTSKIFPAYNFDQMMINHGREQFYAPQHNINAALGRSITEQMPPNYSQVRPFQPQEISTFPSQFNVISNSIADSVARGLNGSRNMSPPPFEPFPKSKSKEFVRLSPARVIVTPFAVENSGNKFYPSNVVHKTFTQVQVTDNDLTNTNKNNISNRNSLQNPNMDMKNNSNIEETINKNSKVPIRPSKPNEINNSTTKPMLPNSKHGDHQHPTIMIKDEKNIMQGSQSPHKDNSGSKPSSSHLHKKTNSLASQTNSKSPRGRIKVQLCTYQDNRCLGIDLTKDKSKEFMMTDETGHRKDVLYA